MNAVLDFGHSSILVIAYWRSSLQKGFPQPAEYVVFGFVDIVWSSCLAFSQSAIAVEVSGNMDYCKFRLDSVHHPYLLPQYGLTSLLYDLYMID